jgi:hypothetical protein
MTPVAVLQYGVLASAYMKAGQPDMAELVLEMRDYL